MSQALGRIRQVARQRKKERLTALLHHISVDCLRMAFFALKRDAAPEWMDRCGGPTKQTLTETS